MRVGAGQALHDEINSGGQRDGKEHGQHCPDIHWHLLQSCTGRCHRRDREENSTGGLDLAHPVNC